MGAHEKPYTELPEFGRTSYQVHCPPLDGEWLPRKRKGTPPENVLVSFYCDDLPDNTILGGHNPKDDYDLVFCVVLYRERSGTVYKFSGFAVRSCCDEYNPTIGARVALANALSCIWNAPFKKAVWDGFVEHFIKGA